MKKASRLFGILGAACALASMNAAAAVSIQATKSSGLNTGGWTTGNGPLAWTDFSFSPTPGVAGTLVVTVAGEGSSSACTVSWAGTPLTLARSSANGSAYTFVYYLSNPTAGSGTLSVAPNGSSSRFGVTAIYATGTVGPEATGANASSGVTSLSAGPITVSSGALVVSGAGHSNGLASGGGFTAGSGIPGGTMLMNLINAGSCGGADYVLAPGDGPLTATWACDPGIAAQNEAVVIVSFAPANVLTVTLEQPVNNVTFSRGTSITGTASVVSGTAPYTLTFCTNRAAGAFAQAGAPIAAPPYRIVFGALANGTYRIYAAATDGASGSATSVTNTFTVANLPPALSLTSPTNGTKVLYGSTVNLAATASDVDGVAGVDFLANGALLNRDTTQPYSFAWSGMAAGSYALKAVADDNAGRAATSAVVNVTISYPPPTVSLTSPANGATFVLGSPIPLTATATSEGLIADVAFYADGAMLNRDADAPYGYTWNNASYGAHTVKAVVTDTGGQTADSATATVTVSGNGSFGVHFNSSVASGGAVVSCVIWKNMVAYSDSTFNTWGPWTDDKGDGEFMVNWGKPGVWTVENGSGRPGMAPLLRGWGRLVGQTQEWGVSNILYASGGGAGVPNIFQDVYDVYLYAAVAPPNTGTSATFTIDAPCRGGQTRTFTAYSGPDYVEGGSYVVWKGLTSPSFRLTGPDMALSALQVVKRKPDPLVLIVR